MANTNKTFIMELATCVFTLALASSAYAWNAQWGPVYTTNPGYQGISQYGDHYSYQQYQQAYQQQYQTYPQQRQQSYQQQYQQPYQNQYQNQYQNYNTQEWRLDPSNVRYVTYPAQRATYNRNVRSGQDQSYTGDLVYLKNYQYHPQYYKPAFETGVYGADRVYNNPVYRSNYYGEPVRTYPSPRYATSYW